MFKLQVMNLCSSCKEYLTCVKKSPEEHSGNNNYCTIAIRCDRQFIESMCHVPF